MIKSAAMLRRSYAEATKAAKKWFEIHSCENTRAQFDAHGGLRDRATGAVYVYFDKKGAALYVGQTGGGVKARTRFVTSPHKKKPWWKKWTLLRFVASKDAADRLVLEGLLITAYQPVWNVKPRAKTIYDLFKD